MNNFDLLEALNNKAKNENIYEVIYKNGKVIVYSRDMPQYKAIGRTEEEAFRNLANLYGEVANSLDKKSKKEEIPVPKKENKSNFFERIVEKFLNLFFRDIEIIKK